MERLLLVVAWLAVCVQLTACYAGKPLDLTDAERAALREDAPTARVQMVQLHPEWPEELRAAVLAGEVMEGMDRTQVLAAWGFPFSRWRPGFIAHPESEIWRYRCVKPPMDVSFLGEAVRHVGFHASGRVPAEPKGQWGYRLKSAAD